MSTISIPGAFASRYSTKPSRRATPVAPVWDCAITATLPSPSSWVIMRAAASAAAASLSVETVVSGMSESTPESNAMTGIPFSCARSR